MVPVGGIAGRFGFIEGCVRISVPHIVSWHGVVICVCVRERERERVCVCECVSVGVSVAERQRELLKPPPQHLQSHCQKGISFCSQLGLADQGRWDQTVTRVTWSLRLPCSRGGWLVIRGKVDE